MFLYHQWTLLPLQTRIRIANEFGVIKKGSTEVVDNTIKSDGYILKELEEALNIDALQKYLNTTETDMQVLWMALIDKAEGRYASPIELNPIVIEPQIVEKKKRGRPRKHE